MSQNPPPSSSAETLAKAGGLDKKYKEKIFETFQRLHGHEGYSGTGIDLALCIKIVQNHNGLIFAESPGQAGALFHK